MNEPLFGVVLVLILAITVAIVVLIVLLYRLSSQLPRHNKSVSSAAEPDAAANLLALNSWIAKLESTDRESIDEIKLQVKNIASLVESVQHETKLSLSALEEIRGESAKAKDLATLQKITNDKFTEQIARNRSWLESPYPKMLAVGHKGAWERLQRNTQYLGVKLAGPIAVVLVCEECGKKSPEEPYPIKGMTVQFEEEAIKFYCITGIAVGLVFLTPHHPLNFIFHNPETLEKAKTLLENHDKVIELGKHMIPEILVPALRNQLKAEKRLDLTVEQTFKAETQLTQLFSSSTLEVITLGGNAHLQFGRLIEEHDEKDPLARRPYGGLVRVLESDDSSYKWVCDECRTKLRKKPEMPSPPISMRAST